MMIAEHALVLRTADGFAIEARLGAPDEPCGGLVACHPHPLYGGDMDNPVVVRAVELGVALRLTTLRFNFRGVGASEGTHGDGFAERDDVRAALAAVESRLGRDAPVLLVGYSFGAAVSAQVAVERRLAGLALIAPPLGVDRYRTLPPWPESLPVLVVAGSDDEYCPVAEVDRLKTARPHATIHVIDGASHFFFGKLYPLGQALDAWARRVLRPERATPG